jgi:hypothetical protein
MQTEGYEFVPNENNEVYVFFSSGFKGIFTKIIVFEKIADKNFNLLFGDYDLYTNTIDDKVITNNGDAIKVLATVVHIINTFFEQNPDVIIQIEGSTEIRTKLYQRIIVNYWAEFSENFSIFGEDNLKSVESFNKTKSYQKIFIKKSKNNETR